jgi:hypothetical protein
VIGANVSVPRGMGTASRSLAGAARVGRGAWASARPRAAATALGRSITSSRNGAIMTMRLILALCLAGSTACLDTPGDPDPQSVAPEVVASELPPEALVATVPGDPMAAARIEPPPTCSTPLTASFKQEGLGMKQGKCKLDTLAGVPGYICVCDNGGTGCGQPK